MAKRPAKNISSLESQMIVPTLTTLGRLREWIRALKEGAGALGAVVTGDIMSPRPDISRSGRRVVISPPTCTAAHLRILLLAVVRLVVVEARTDGRAPLRSVSGRRVPPCG